MVLLPQRAFIALNPGNGHLDDGQLSKPTQSCPGISFLQLEGKGSTSFFPINNFVCKLMVLEARCKNDAQVRGGGERIWMGREAFETIIELMEAQQVPHFGGVIGRILSLVSIYKLSFSFLYWFFPLQNEALKGNFWKPQMINKTPFPSLIKTKELEATTWFV